MSQVRQTKQKYRNSRWPPRYYLFLELPNCDMFTGILSISYSVLLVLLTSVSDPIKINMKKNYLFLGTEYFKLVYTILIKPIKTFHPKVSVQPSFPPFPSFFRAIVHSGHTFLHHAIVCLVHTRVKLDHTRVQLDRCSLWRLSTLLVHRSPIVLIRCSIKRVFEHCSHHGYKRI